MQERQDQDLLSGRKLEVDDYLAVHVPPGLKLDRGADLPGRESCRDGHTELARRDQASNLLYGHHEPSA